MAYSTTYQLKSFDALTSRLTVTVQVLYDSTLTETKEINVTLPVNSQGFVTTDMTLIDQYVRTAIDRRLPYLAQRVPPGGVVNAPLIYSITSDTESEQLALGTGYVLLTANPDYTAPVTLECTRSVITVITNRTNLARPPEDGGYTIVGLDNGNVVSSDGLTLVQTAGETEQAGAFAIIAANDNTDTLPVPPWVYTVFPNFLDNTQVTSEEGFDGYQYYIEHDPIVINVQATAIFNY